MLASVLVFKSEMINQHLGYSDRAERTMDIYTAAVLAEKLTDRVTPPDSWKDMMNTLSDISCDRYVMYSFTMSMTCLFLIVSCNAILGTDKLYEEMSALFHIFGRRHLKWNWRV